MHLPRSITETWLEADLGATVSPYARRAWRRVWFPRRRGHAVLMARARDSAGRVQPLRQRWNRLGYCNNATAPVDVTVL